MGVRSGCVRSGYANGVGAVGGRRVGRAQCLCSVYLVGVRSGCVQWVCVERSGCA